MGMQENVDIHNRLENEKDHGVFLSSKGAEAVWNWASPAGLKRAQRRASFIARELSEGRKALEIGCGTGLFTRMVSHSAASIVATDLSEVLLNEARQQCDAPNVTFEVADAHALSYADGSFDVVFGSSILHHLEVERALREILRVLKPGGLMVFAEPNMVNPQIWAERNIPIVRKWAGASPDETAFVRFVLARMMQRIGFTGIEIMPHEFLHPAIPAPLIATVERLTLFLEKLPGVREIGGSLLIRGTKPA